MIVLIAASCSAFAAGCGMAVIFGGRAPLPFVGFAGAAAGSLVGNVVAHVLRWWLS